MVMLQTMEELNSQLADTTTFKEEEVVTLFLMF
jgi:hypothetical protein